MKLKLTLLVLVLFATILTEAQEKETPTFGKGIFNLVGKDSTWSMKIGARMQFLAASTWPEDQKNESEFLVRRARLKFDGFAYSPKLRYELQLGLSNSDISGASQFTGNAPRYIFDAVIKYNFYKNFELWFGQTKLPGNREQLISSGNLQLVDRSLLNHTFSVERDMGIQIHHHFNLTDTFVVREIVTISQGEGRNITTGNLGGYQYTGRFELLPFGMFAEHGDYSGGDLSIEKNPKLAIATAYDFNNDAVKTSSNQGSYMVNDVGFFETNISTLFFDAMFKYQGFSVMAEYAERHAKNQFATNSDGSLTGDMVQTGKGVNLQGGYLFKTKWELSGRYTHVDLDRAVGNENKEEEYTLGVSKYIVGHKLKVQSDLSYSESNSRNNELVYRLQFDIQF